ncbi:MAG: signal peptidase I [Pseudomonadota bacterium]
MSRHGIHGKRDIMGEVEASQTVKSKPLLLVFAMVLPPFVYLYLQRPICFLVAILIGIIAIPPSLHAPWIWLLFAGAVSAHVLLIGPHEDDHRPVRWYATPIGVMLCLLLVLGSFTAVRLLLLDVHRVSSGSMEPGLMINDLLVVKKWEDPVMERGRVYTFRFEGDSAIYVKRLIGQPGDVVTLRGNLLELNGIDITRSDGAENLTETLDGNAYAVLDLYNIKKFRRDWHLGRNEYFFLGDNRSNSIDSRIRGTVPRERIIGEAKVIRTR